MQGLHNFSVSQGLNPLPTNAPLQGFSDHRSPDYRSQITLSLTPSTHTSHCLTFLHWPALPPTPVFRLPYPLA